jgi:site-specific recombinase XerD
MIPYLAEFQRSLSLRNLCPSSIEDYTRDITLLFQYLKSDLQHITQSEIEEALFHITSDHQLKAVTLNHKITSTRLFFSFLHRRGYIPQDPAETLPSARRIKGEPRRFLEKEEIQSLLNVSLHENFLHHAILYTYYELGLRVSELIALQIPDVDSTTMKMRIQGKGRKVRYLDFSEELLHKLRSVIKTPYGYRTKGPLFLRRDFTPLNRTYLWHMIKYYARKAGITQNISLKSLRHTHATHSLAAGIDLFALQRALGHSALTSTQVYTHLLPASSRASHQKFLSYALAS